MARAGRRPPGIVYDEYIVSAAWRATRARYWASRMPTDCGVCGIGRQPGMHLHHRTYKNLGCERLMDLVPLCPRCHELTHEIRRLRGSPLWGAHVYARRYIFQKAWPPRRGNKRDQMIPPPTPLAKALRLQILEAIKVR
jgi:hypothetical protein